MNIRLTRPHAHDGKYLAIGTEMDVPEDTALWLIGQRVAEATHLDQDAPPPAADSPPARKSKLTLIRNKE